jgi:hypothetical protein
MLAGGEGGRGGATIAPNYPPTHTHRYMHMHYPFHPISPPTQTHSQTHAFALLPGRNDHGQLGDGSTTDSAVPLEMSGANTWSAVSAGAYHTCGLKTSGALFCWGELGWGVGMCVVVAGRGMREWMKYEILV